MAKKIWDFINLNLTKLYAILLLLFLILNFFNIEILKIIIWPSLIAVFIFSFKEQLSALMNRIIGVKLPGGGELRIQEIPDDSQKAIEKFEIQYSNIIREKEIEIEQRQSENEQTKAQLIQQIAALNIIISFERICNFIFKSQIDLLWKLQEHKTSGLSKSTIETYFGSLKSSSPLIFSNWTWLNYIHFLNQQNLMVLSENGNFTITDYGSAFLEYILSMNYEKFTGL